MNFQEILCKIFGHDWIFPHHILVKNERLIESRDYICLRCGISRDKVEDNKPLPEFEKLKQKYNI